MNGAEWFFLESGRQMGPVPLEQLLTSLKTRLPRDTLVWRDGMADWMKALEVKDLAAALGGEAAPPPPPATAPAPASPRVAPAAASARPTYRAPASAAAPRATAPRRDDDEPYTLNPFALFARCFRFAGRFDRAQFAIACFGNALLVFAVLLGFGVVAGATGGGDTRGIVVGVLFLILTPLFIGIGLGSMVRRLNDIGQPGWYAVVALVPCLGFLFLIYLLAAPGNAHPAPSPAGGILAIVIGVVVVFVGIAGIGIVAAIAIPSKASRRRSSDSPLTTPPSCSSNRCPNCASCSRPTLKPLTKGTPQR